MDEVIFHKLKNLFSQSKVLCYKKDEMIIRADDIPSGVFFLKNGFVRLYSIFEDGRELTLNIFKPGCFFSMMWAIADVPNAYYFQAMTAVELQRASKELVIDFVKKNPDVLFDLTRRILIGLDGLLTNIKYLLSGDAYHRVISALLLSAKRFGKKRRSDDIIINLPLTHQDIAHLAGITRETASLAMSKLARKKLITYSHRLLVICNIQKLEEASRLNRNEPSLPFAL